MAKIQILPNGCQILKSNSKSDTYAQFWYKDTNYRAHVFAYETFVGPIPPFHHVHHKCEFKKCVNTEHFELVHEKDHPHLDPNNICAQNKLKTHCPKGHEYTPENTQYDKKGRQCKKCKRELDRLRYSQGKKKKRNSVIIYSSKDS